MTRPAELESRRLSSSAGRVIVSRSSGAPELLNLDYRAHFQHISRRRHMQVRGEFSHMGCPWAVRAAVRPLRSEPERTPARPASGGGAASARARAGLCADFTVKVLCKEDKQPDRSTRSHGIHMFVHSVTQMHESCMPTQMYNKAQGILFVPLSESLQ